MTIWSAEIKELEKLFESLKGRLPDLEKELERLIKADDENMVLLYSRRCLEVIITDLCECELKRPRKTEPLKGIIDKLHKEEKVPSHIITSMHGLNELSAYGAHPKDFDSEQIKPVLVNFDIIIKWYLKCKETGTDIKAKPVEVIKQKIRSTEDVKKNITISRKRLAGLLGGLISIIAVVFAVLYFSKIIGGGKPIKEIEKSIAVLPFENMSNDPEQEDFCDGIMQEILNHLFMIEGLSLPSSTSSLGFKGSKLSPREIARKLDVNYLLKGNVSKSDDNVRIIVRMVNGKNGKILWAEDYKRTMTATDLLEIQSDVAQKVAENLDVAINPEVKNRIDDVPTKNTEAYILFLRCASGNQEFDHTMPLLERAISLDPGFADAYALLALNWAYEGGHGGSLPREQVLGKAEPLIANAFNWVRIPY